MININNFNSNLLKIDKKSYKNINIYYNGYITMKDLDYVNVHSVNPLYSVINKADGYIEEKNENRYSTLVFNDKKQTHVNKKVYRTWDKPMNPVNMKKGFITINLIQMMIYLWI